MIGIIIIIIITVLLSFQISNINNLLRSNLEEPDDADVMRELQKHKDIMLYEY